MAKILFVSSSLLGALYPSVELARRILRAGHRVSFTTFAAGRSVVEENGIDFLPLDQSRYEALLAQDSKCGTLARLRRLESRRRKAMDSLAVSDLVQAVERLTPDLILINGEMHEHIIALSASGVPMALLNSFVSIWRRPGLPPPHCLARPGIGFKGSRAGIWLLWQSLRLKKRWRTLLLAARRVGCDRVSILRRLALESGFDFDNETDDEQWLMPFTYRRLPVLSLRALEFEFEHQPPESVHYVGPMLLENRGDARVSKNVSADLEAIFEDCHRTPRTLIYAGFGSFFSAHLELVRRLVDAVAKREDWELVVSLGGKLDPAELGSLPERVHAFDWLPQPDVLQHADVAVVHGGINTVDECVLNRVPMLVYCGFETDMAGTTSRIVHHGIGIAGDAKRDSQQAIQEQIERLLREPRYRRALNELRSRYVAYAENQVAESTVESLLDRARAECTS
jgi:UDP:flavonoid glycosyltransferase YjiC (YdhE family)